MNTRGGKKKTDAKHDTIIEDITARRANPTPDKPSIEVRQPILARANITHYMMESDRLKRAHAIRNRRRTTITQHI